MENITFENWVKNPNADDLICVDLSNINDHQLGTILMFLRSINSDELEYYLLSILDTDSNVYKNERLKKFFFNKFRGNLLKINNDINDPRISKRLLENYERKRNRRGWVSTPEFPRLWERAKLKNT